MNKKEKIGMYSIDEIYEELANGFLQRSMVDAIFDKIHSLITENEQLKEDKKFYADAFLNLRNRNDRAIEYINKHIRIDDEYPAYMELLIEERDELLEILKGENNE